MPPEHGVVSSNLTGRATFKKSSESDTAKHYIKPSLGLTNEALENSRGELHGSRREGPALSKPPFHLLRIEL